ncbi:SEL1-like repeat protein [Roseomonas marmotae]|uniref:Sel1 repeat family protein n=1 Tax=Roseomonas marmotae TaxID=2768161 RepID=A0ABS3K7I4_9PROT|nr:hypothetical protein [Roseomonas marmotae]MBO1073439.1 hypothetical protein [Roseomonas marmotae]QTI80365.1 hypothetical protein IAI58_06365 [Roseomonas marmotae]
MAPAFAAERLKSGWLHLSNARLGPLPIPVALLHPRSGIALFELPPDWTPDLDQTFAQELAAQGFTARYPGHLPIVHRRLRQDDLPYLESILSEEFLWRDPITVPEDSGWCDALQTLLTPLPAAAPAESAPAPARPAEPDLPPPAPMAEAPVLPAPVPQPARPRPPAPAPMPAAVAAHPARRSRAPLVASVLAGAACLVLVVQFLPYARWLDGFRGTVTETTGLAGAIKDAEQGSIAARAERLAAVHPPARPVVEDEADAVDVPPAPRAGNAPPMMMASGDQAEPIRPMMDPEAPTGSALLRTVAATIATTPGQDAPEPEPAEAALPPATATAAPESVPAAAPPAEAPEPVPQAEMVEEPAPPSAMAAQPQAEEPAAPDSTASAPPAAEDTAPSPAPAPVAAEAPPSAPAPAEPPAIVAQPAPEQPSEPEAPAVAAPAAPEAEAPAVAESLPVVPQAASPEPDAPAPAPAPALATPAPVPQPATPPQAVAAPPAASEPAALATPAPPQATAPAVMAPQPAPAPAMAPQPAVAAPAPPPPAARTPADPAMLTAMMRRGEALLALEDVSGARRFFERAAGMGSGPAAQVLAETYDPQTLAARGVRGLQPDPAAALLWYRRAAQLGAPVQSRITALESRK